MRITSLEETRARHTNDIQYTGQKEKNSTPMYK